MEIQYHGANCVRISTKKATVVVDDNLESLGLKSVARPGDIVLVTDGQKLKVKEPKIIIDQPGEYEVADCSIQGVGVRSHMDEEGKRSATMYRLTAEDLRIGIVGHVWADLHEDELEALSTIDVLIIPVGGSGYTLDSVDALKVIKEVEPKLVIPTHYDDKAIKYEVPQASLEDALKGLAMEPKETVAKLKLKSGESAENTQLIVLERQ